MRRRSILLPLALAPLAAAVAVTVQWRQHKSSGPAEARVTQAVLDPGQIVLVVANGSKEEVRVRQVIVNDAFVGFRRTRGSMRPGASDRITVAYPWVNGEAYDVRLLTATGATIDYQLEDAAPGTRSA